MTPRIAFYSDSNRLPFASTCSLVLNISSGMTSSRIRCAQLCDVAMVLDMCNSYIDVYQLVYKYIDLCLVTVLHLWLVCGFLIENIICKNHKVKHS